MQKLNIYLDTSVINFLLAEDAPDFRRATEDFFARCASQHELYGSDVLLRELQADPVAERRQHHFAVLKNYSVAILPRDRDTDVAHLAEAYLRQLVVPANKRNDALHVAYATVFGMDVVLSWNFKHLANLHRESRFAAVNLAEGYSRSPRIVSPLEVEDESDS